MRIEFKGALIGLAAAGFMLASTFSLAQLLQSTDAADAKPVSRTNSSPAQAGTLLVSESQRGYNLFEHNCAPCHGEDARGDEGPNLHNLAKSDARITTIIKGGVKGEMPSFAKKFNDADVQALIAFLRTLKN